MSTSMKGNDHVAKAKFMQEIIEAREQQADLTIAAISALTEATLALAYEQRTANLIAYATSIDNTDAAVFAQIKEGTGL